MGSWIAMGIIFGVLFLIGRYGRVICEEDQEEQTSKAQK